jgi:hypothetical protein
MKENKRKLFFCLILITGLVLLTACGTNNDPNQAADTNLTENSPDEDSQAPQQEDSQADENQSQLSDEEIQEAIQIKWDNSSHAAAFVLDESNENNRCAKCHSPINFQPTLDDLPESCFSCKFELEDPEPFISEQDWTNIPCMVCHEVGKKDKVDPEFKWLEIAQLEEYGEVGSATDLCQKCHVGDGFSNHGGIQDLGVHQDMMCTSCHDAHSTQASCLDAGCHEGIMEPSISGHTEEHSTVACVACHDASGMMLDYREEDNLFSTKAVISTEEGESIFFFSSHNLQLESSCDRCHFVGNPWDIAESIEQE